MTPRSDIVVTRARIADLLLGRASLTPREHERAAGMSSRTAAEFVAARALLRHVLGAAIDRDPLAIEIVEPDGGKPHLPDGELDFNLAHAGDWVVVALARGCRVGVDVEPLATRRDASAIADAFGLALDPTLPFAQQWVRVEARYKAAGVGLEIPIDPAVGRDYTVVDLQIASDHAAAVAWDARDVRLTMKDWS